MPVDVEVEGWGVIHFPDGTSEDEAKALVLDNWDKGRNYRARFLQRGQQSYSKQLSQDVIDPDTPTGNFFYDPEKGTGYQPLGPGQSRPEPSRGPLASAAAAARRVGSSFLNTAGSMPGRIGQSALRVALGEKADKNPVFQFLKEGQEARDLSYGVGSGLADAVGSGLASGVTLAAGSAAAPRLVMNALAKLGATARAQRLFGSSAAAANAAVQAAGQTFNSEYEQARREGASENQALAQAWSASGIESVGDYFLGGAGRLAKKVVSDTARKLGLPAGKRLAGESVRDVAEEAVLPAMARAALIEGGQEATTGAAADLSANLIYGAGRRPLDWDARVADFVGGAAAGPVFRAAERSSARQQLEKMPRMSPVEWTALRIDTLEELDPDITSKAREAFGGKPPLDENGLPDMDAVRDAILEGRLSVTPEARRFAEGWVQPELFGVVVEESAAPEEPGDVKASSDAPSLSETEVPPDAPSSEMADTKRSVLDTLTKVDAGDEEDPLELDRDPRALGAQAVLDDVRGSRAPGRAERLEAGLDLGVPGDAVAPGSEAAQASQPVGAPDVFEVPGVVEEPAPGGAGSDIPLGLERPVIRNPRLERVPGETLRGLYDRVRQTVADMERVFDERELTPDEKIALGEAQDMLGSLELEMFRRDYQGASQSDILDGLLERVSAREGSQRGAEFDVLLEMFDPSAVSADELRAFYDEVRPGMARSPDMQEVWESNLRKLRDVIRERGVEPSSSRSVATPEKRSVVAARSPRALAAPASETGRTPSARTDSDLDRVSQPVGDPGVFEVPDLVQDAQPELPVLSAKGEAEPKTETTDAELNAALRLQELKARLDALQVQRKELSNQAKEVAARIDALESQILPKKRSSYDAKTPKKSAKKSDVAEWRRLQKVLKEYESKDAAIYREVDALRREYSAARMGVLAVSQNALPIERAAAKAEVARQYGSSQEYKQALDDYYKVAEEFIRERIPDASEGEISTIRMALLGDITASRFNADEGIPSNILLDLKVRRSKEVQNYADEKLKGLRDSAPQELLSGLQDLDRRSDLISRNEIEEWKRKIDDAVASIKEESARSREQKARREVESRERFIKQFREALESDDPSAGDLSKSGLPTVEIRADVPPERMPGKSRSVFTALKHVVTWDKDRPELRGAISLGGVLYASNGAVAVKAPTYDSFPDGLLTINGVDADSDGQLIEGVDARPMDRIWDKQLQKLEGNVVGELILRDRDWSLIRRFSKLRRELGYGPKDGSMAVRLGESDVFLSPYHLERAVRALTGLGATRLRVIYGSGGPNPTRIVTDKPGVEALILGLREAVGPWIRVGMQMGPEEGWVPEPIPEPEPRPKPKTEPSAAEVDVSAAEVDAKRRLQELQGDWDKAERRHRALERMIQDTLDEIASLEKSIFPEGRSSRVKKVPKESAHPSDVAEWERLQKLLRQYRAEELESRREMSRLDGDLERARMQYFAVSNRVSPIERAVGLLEVELNSNGPGPAYDKLVEDYNRIAEEFIRKHLPDASEDEVRHLRLDLMSLIRDGKFDPQGGIPQNLMRDLAVGRNLERILAYAYRQFEGDMDSIPEELQRRLDDVQRRVDFVPEEEMSEIRKQIDEEAAKVLGEKRRKLESAASSIESASGEPERASGQSSPDYVVVGSPVDFDSPLVEEAVSTLKLLSASRGAPSRRRADMLRSALSALGWVEERDESSGMRTYRKAVARGALSEEGLVMVLGRRVHSYFSGSRKKLSFPKTIEAVQRLVSAEKAMRKVWLKEAFADRGASDGESVQEEHSNERSKNKPTRSDASEAERAEQQESAQAPPNSGERSEHLGGGEAEEGRGKDRSSDSTPGLDSSRPGQRERTPVSGGRDRDAAGPGEAPESADVAGSGDLPESGPVVVDAAGPGPDLGLLRSKPRPPMVVTSAAKLPDYQRRVSETDYNGALDEHQREGVNRILTAFLDNQRAGFMLADGAGFGKTRQLLAVADRVYRAKQADSDQPPRILIVTKNVRILEGRFKPDAAVMGIDTDRFMLATYDSFKKLAGQRFDAVIYDEAHSLKNSDSGRSIVSESIKSDHVLFATATPMDRRDASVYFLSKLSGSSEKVLAAKLGLARVARVTPRGDTYYVYEQMKGVSDADVRRNLVSFRDSSVANGVFLRRAYPFWGEVIHTAINKGDIPQESLEDHDDLVERVRSYYLDEKMAGKPRHMASAIATAQAMEASRVYSEGLKVGLIMRRIKESLDAGLQVVVFGSSFRYSPEGSGVDVPGLLTLLPQALEEAGIPYRLLAGSGPGLKAIQDFQSGKVRVLVSSPEKGGTGIDLDDATGDSPRHVIVGTTKPSGDLVDQMLFRVSRKSTKSPSIFEFMTTDGLFGDDRYKVIADKKIRTLRLIQGGVDMDAATFGSSDTDVSTLVQSNVVSPVGSRAPPRSVAAPVSRPGAERKRPATAASAPSKSEDVAVLVEKSLESFRALSGGRVTFKTDRFPKEVVAAGGRRARDIAGLITRLTSLISADRESLDAVGEPVTVSLEELSDRYGSAWAATDIEHNIIRVDVERLRKALMSISEGRKAVSLFRIEGLDGGLSAVFREEAIHLITGSVLRRIHQERFSSVDFSEWVESVSRDVEEAAPKPLVRLVKGMYGDSPLLGLELVRMAVQYLRHDGGRPVFTEDFLSRLEGRDVEHRNTPRIKSFLKKLVSGVGVFQDAALGAAAELDSRGLVVAGSLASEVAERLQAFARKPDVRPGRKESFDDAASTQMDSMLLSAAFEELLAIDPAITESLFGGDPTPSEGVDISLRLIVLRDSLEKARKLSDGLKKALVRMDTILSGLYDFSAKALLRYPGLGSSAAESAVARIARRNIFQKIQELSHSGKPFSEWFSKGGVDIRKAVSLAVKEYAKNPEPQSVSVDDVVGLSTESVQEPSRPGPDKPDKKRSEKPSKKSPKKPSKKSVRKVAKSMGIAVRDYFKGFREGLLSEQVELIAAWIPSVDWESIDSVDSLRKAAEAHADTLKGEDADLFSEAVDEVIYVLARDSGVEMSMSSGGGSNDPVVRWNEMREQAGRQVQRRYDNATYRSNMRVLRRVLEYANKRRASQGLEPLSLMSPELSEYGPAVSIDSFKVEQMQHFLRSEGLARAVARLRSRLRQAEEFRDRLRRESVPQAHRDYADDRVEQARDDLAKLEEKLDGEGRSDVLDRADELDSLDLEFEDIESSRIALRLPEVRSVLEGVELESDLLEFLFGVSEEDIPSFVEAVSTEVTEDSPEAEQRRYARAKYHLFRMSRRVAEIRDAHRKARSHRRQLRERYQRELKELHHEIQQALVEQDELEVYVRDLLVRDGEGLGTGSFLPKDEIDALSRYSSAIVRLAQAFAEAEDGSVAADVYDVVTRPPDPSSVQAGLLRRFAAERGTTPSALAQKLGVSETVLSGIMEDAVADMSVGELLRELTLFLRTGVYLSRYAAVTSDTPGFFASDAANSLSMVRKGLRKALRKTRQVRAHLRAADKAVDVLGAVLESPEFREAERTVGRLSGPSSEGAFRMVELVQTKHILHGFSFGGREQPEVELSTRFSAERSEHWFQRISEWAYSARDYVRAWTEINDARLRGEDVSLEDYGMDARVARGLMDALQNDIPTLLDVYNIRGGERYGEVSSAQAFLQDPQYLGGLLHSFFAQPERVLRQLKVPSSKLIVAAVRDASWADRVINQVRNAHIGGKSIRRVIHAAVTAHNKAWNTQDYRREVFDVLAPLARQVDSPVREGYVLPTGYVVTRHDIQLLRKLEEVYRQLFKAFGPRVTRGIEEKIDSRTLIRQPVPVGDFSISRKISTEKAAEFVSSAVASFESAESVNDVLGVLGVTDNLDESVRGSLVSLWDRHPEHLAAYMFDSQLPESDRSLPKVQWLRDLQKEWFSRAHQEGRFNDLREGLTVDQLIDELIDLIPEVESSAGTTPAAVRSMVERDLVSMTRAALDLFREANVQDYSRHVRLEVESADNMFTKPSNTLKMPSSMYVYGALTDMELHQFFASPRMVMDTRLLNVIESALKEAQSYIDRGKLPPGVRSIADFDRLVRAARRVRDDLAAVHHQRDYTQRLHEDASPSGVTIDFARVTHAAVLTPLPVVMGNTFLAPFAFFEFYQRQGRAVQGMLAALSATVSIPLHITAAIAKAAASVFSEAASKIPGVDQLFRGGESVSEWLVDRMDEASSRVYRLMGVRLQPTQESVKKLGIVYRPKFRDSVFEINQEYHELYRGKSILDWVKGNVARGLKIAVAGASKIGIDAGDRVVNQAALSVAQDMENRLGDAAIRYGRAMEHRYPGQEFDIRQSKWRVRPERNPLGWSEVELTALREYFERLGRPLEQLLWDMYQVHQLEQDGLDAVHAGDQARNDAIREIYTSLKEGISHQFNRLAVMTAEELNAPGRFNRSLAPRVNAVFRILSPLQGYSGNLFMNLIEAVRAGTSAGDDWKRKLAVWAANLTALLLAAIFQGWVSVTAREHSRRAIGRSTGQAVLGDADFNRDVRELTQALKEGDFKLAARHTEPMLVGASAALPYVGDLMLMFLSRFGTSYSRGHLFDFSNRSLVLQFGTQIFTGLGWTLQAVPEGLGPDAARIATEDFIYRWVPYSDLFVKITNVGHNGQREKYMNSIALRTEAVRSGIAEPSRGFSRGGGPLLVTPSILKRKLSEAASDRDAEAARETFQKLVRYYQEGPQGERRSYQEARRLALGAVERLSPMSRAVSHRRITQGERRRILGRVTGERRGRIDEAIQDYRWLSRQIGAAQQPEVRK